LHETEGGLAKRHAALACTETLSSIARTLGLSEAVDLAPAERAAGGDKQDNLMADSMEAVIGAAYLDGGLKVCEDIIRGLWGEKVHVLHHPPLDPKTGLQEWAQARGLPVPKYEILKRDGPDHAPLFTISVSVEGFPSFEAIGASRRVAEKEAARLLLEHIQTLNWQNHDPSTK
jgi:ribonuclease-3